MDFVDVSEHAHGFIAIGQEARGIIAIGQVATGVIAIGQGAHGIIAIGQLAVGLVGWGQVGLGIFSAAGMVGAGGRRMLGIVVPLVPSIGRPVILPEAAPLNAVLAGGEGWLDVELARDAVGLGLFSDGHRLPVKLDRRLQTQGAALASDGSKRVRAYTRRLAGTLVCDRIAYAPERPYERKSFATRALFQLVGLVAVACLWAHVAGHDVITMLGEFATEEAAPAAMPAAPRPPSTAMPRQKR